MPVNVKNNLTLENNTMDATYYELFHKLNVAKGWTNTQTTSSGGTAVVLVNDGDILTTMACNDINKCYCPITNQYTDYSKLKNTAIIINGKIYFINNNNLVQQGSKLNYVKITENSTGFELTNNVYGIDEDGKLWYISNGVETQIGTSTDWEFFGYNCSGNNTQYSYAINNGGIYFLSGTSEPTRLFSSLNNVSYSSLSKNNNSNSYSGCILDGENIYKVTSNTLTLIGQDKLWKYINNDRSNFEIVAIDSNDDAYRFATNNAFLISNAKKAFMGQYDYYSIILTNDKKIYSYYRGSNSVTDISNNINWVDISTITPYGSNGFKFYAITEDGKLYSIMNDSSNTTYTQIGTETNYQKVEGRNVSSNSNYYALAWTGDATTVTHTIFTTKEPQTNDVAYVDKDLTKYSTIQSVSGTTVTDEYRTYDRDVSKDTNFTAIPPATVHETVSTIDFLRITNPNT